MDEFTQTPQIPSHMYLVQDIGNKIPFMNREGSYLHHVSQLVPYVKWSRFLTKSGGKVICKVSLCKLYSEKEEIITYKRTSLPSNIKLDPV